MIKRNFRNKLLKISLSSILLVGCFVHLSAKSPADLANDRLTAKKEQLTKILLAHYAAPKDKLKRKAVTYLMNEIADKEHYSGVAYQAYLDSLLKYKANSDMFNKRNNELKYNEYNLQSDLSIQPDYLIRNIDEAFDVLHKAAYAKKISFTDFCEYSLPYNYNSPGLEDWRTAVLKSVPEYIYSIKDIEIACLAVRRLMAKQRKDFHDGNATFLDIPYSILNIVPQGVCSVGAEYGVFFMRAVGLPVSQDFAINYANRASGHTWCVLILNNKKSKPFNMPFFDSINANNQRDYNIYKQPDYKLSKVYRNVFSKNTESHISKRGECYFLPEIFNNPYLLDVTEQYTKVTKVQIPVLSNTEKSTFAYLCVFDNKDWQVTAWGNIKENTAIYDKIATDVAYLPVTMDSPKMNFINYPFINDTNGKIRILKPNTEKTQKLVLTRKYKEFKAISIYVERMVGGVFQAADNKNFENAVDLYTIKTNPGGNFQEITINNTVDYRYYRYLSPKKSFGNIAELSFFDTRTEPTALKGDIIGTDGSWNNNQFNTKRAVFDGNPLSYFDSKIEDNSWVGLDFGKSIAVNKIRYMSRNDCNSVFNGHDYELFYWSLNGWKSLGRKIATADNITFDNAPSNALFLLHCYTEGKEERIFTYENGKQVWW